MATARFLNRASLLVLAFAAVAFPLAVPHTAHAEGEAHTVAVVQSQFTDRVEASKPVGDASTLKDASKATYWLDVSNAGKDPVQITLVWTIDGKESAKQTLEIGHSSHWRTWGSWSIKNAHAVHVNVLDADGTSLKEDDLKI